MNHTSPVQPLQVPHILSDFNAVGWSGEADDSCFYILDILTLSQIRAYAGMRIFVWMYDDSEEETIVGCEAILEWVVLTKEGWRARPDETTWYRGPKRW